MTFLEWLYFLSAGLVGIGCVSVTYLWARATSHFWRKASDRSPLGLWNNQALLLAVGLALASASVALGSALRGAQTAGLTGPIVTYGLLAVMFVLYFAKVLKSRAGAFNPETGRETKAWHLFVWSSIAWTVAVTLWWILS